MVQLLKPKVLAERLQVSKAQAYKMLADGTLPRVSIGRAVRVREEDVERWVREQSQAAAGA